MDSSDRNAFRETRLALEPSSPSSVVNINIPSPYQWPRSKSVPKIPNNSALDETSFRRSHLATASAIFYRTSTHAPRSFLWRVLEAGAVLSIRAIDVHRDSKDVPDASLVLNFRFDAPLLPSCVALADSPDHDVLYVFALDQTLRLSCLALRPDLFRKRSGINAGLGDAYKFYQPAEITSQHPHRLYAASPDLLVVALHDGSLVKLERSRPGGDGPYRHRRGLT